MSSKPKKSIETGNKRRFRSAVSIRIGLILLLSGLLCLVLSVFENQQVLALIGLGLTFWGVLFFVVAPTRYVEGSLLYNASIGSYLTIDRIINDFKYSGKGYYIPSYPEDVYTPEHLKGLKETVVFISAEKEDSMPSLQDIAEKKFLTEKPKGIIISPPGIGLFYQIEKKSKIDFTTIELDQLCQVLPAIILENFGLAQSVAMTLEENSVKLRVTDSLYNPLYKEQNKSKSVGLLGCPLVSAIGCILAKTARKNVSIEKSQILPDGSTIEVLYKIMRGHEE